MESTIFEPHLVPFINQVIQCHQAPKILQWKNPKSLAQELWQKILLSKPEGPHLNDVSLCLTTNFNDGDGGSRPDNLLAFFFPPAGSNCTTD
jgi:hypothetical protein